MFTKNLILEIAKSAISNKLFETPIITKYDVVKESPEFVKLGATFVTINKNGNLRGCIGSLVSHRELYDDLVSNAVNAAFKDPRFKPVSQEEFNSLSIEVSILSHPVEIQYESKKDLKTKVIPGKDGIILKQNSKQATFLPQVWESLNTFEAFFAALCQKANLEPECLDAHPKIFKYGVKKYK